jgi:hypothetical protein
VLAGYPGSSYISRIYRNDAGTFTHIGAGLTGVYNCAVAWGDYDNDGDLDLLLTGYTGSARISRVYRNDGGTFTDIGAGLTGVDRSAVAWGDYDNDGDLDLVLAGYTGSSYISRIYRNDGGTLTRIYAGLPGVHYSAAAWGDYDNDGDLDLVLAGWTGSNYISRIYRNNSTAANTPPTAPSGLSAGLVGNTVTLSWNAASDNQTPASGLSYNLRVGATPGGGEVFSGMADAGGWRRLPALGNANENLTWSVTLPGNGAYYWSVQAVDTAWAGGPWAGGEVIANGSSGEASKTGSPMTATKGSGTAVNLTYTPANCATDHAVYWGTSPLSGSLNWTGAACGRGSDGTTAFDPGDPPAGNFYYFVIAGNNGSNEGSYGKDSTDAERPVSPGAECFPQQLTGACP